MLFKEEMYNKMFNSASQAGQDLFVYKVLKNKNNGTFLDIGAGECNEVFVGYNGGNNTVSLSKLGWRGIGVDYTPSCASQSNINRYANFIIADVTNMNWDRTISENSILQNTVDYLSFDVDDSTLEAINNFPFDKLRFRVITIEHDSYRVGNNLKNYMRELLKGKGYELLCSDVQVLIKGQSPWIYEDWWVDPKEVDMEYVEKFRSDKTLGQVIASL